MTTAQDGWTIPGVNNDLSRRTLLVGAVAGVSAAALSSLAMGQARPPQPPLEVDLDKIERIVVNGRINQGICGVGLGRMPLEMRCAMLAKMGVKAVDFAGPGDWPTLKKHGLVCSLARGSGGIASGWNRRENHARLAEDMKRNIDLASEAGWGTVITFSGNRQGLSDEEGAKNCIEGLKLVAAHAEQKKVTIVTELLNSKRNHPDYQADRTPWGVQVCKGVGSDRVKLLYDIYHMQIMEGDMIATIREFKDFIAHYHTAGNPGRNELDENQEIYYPAVMRAILATGYNGYVSHEYGPRGDPIKALIQAVKVCDV
jgi:hydroxypyruvate isomerase